MKRLKKLAYGKTLYHGTSYENFLKIYEANGIVPQADQGAGIGVPKPDEDDFYDEFGEDEWEEQFEEAWEFYVKQEEGFYGFTFFAGGMNTARGYIGGNKGVSVVLEADISEDALLPDDNDAPNAKTWQESLKAVDQVKVLGEVTSDHIKRLHFFNEKGQKAFITTWDRWQEDYEKNKSKFEDDYDHQFDPNVEEDGGALFQYAQKAGLTVQNNTVVNPSLDSMVEVYNKLTEVKGKQESLRGYFGEDGNVYFTYQSIVDLNSASTIGNFVYVGGSTNCIFYVNYNTMMDFVNSNPSFVQNLRTVFGDKEFTISMSTFTVDYLVERAQKAQQQTANTKRLMRKEA
jgi:hypothetical protein